MTAVVPLLSARHQRLLGFIRDYWVSFDRPPTLSEMAVACGLSPNSTHAVTVDLLDLQRAGWIRRVPGRHRAIEVLDPTTGRAA